MSTVSLYTGAVGVLCPELYNRLTEVFGRAPSVSNRGCARQPEIDAQGEYYCVNCPWCGDTKKRLWINHMFGQPGPGGRPMRHLAHCFRDCLSEWSRRRELYDRVCGFRNPGERAVPFQVLQGAISDNAILEVQLPGITWPVAQLPDVHAAKQYLLGRGYTQESLARFEIGYCDFCEDEPWLEGRIIFPIRFRGMLIGYQARVCGRATERSKYISSTGLPRRRVLYNFDRAIYKPLVVLTEGPTSANAVGDAGVGSLGKSITMQQVELLAEHWAGRPVVIWLDPDARQQSGTTLHWLSQLGRNPVVEVAWDHGDPGDVGSEACWQIINMVLARAGLPSCAGDPAPPVRRHA